MRPSLYAQFQICTKILTSFPTFACYKYVKGEQTSTVNNQPQSYLLISILSMKLKKQGCFLKNISSCFNVHMQFLTSHVVRNTTLSVSEKFVNSDLIYPMEIKFFLKITPVQLTYEANTSVLMENCKIRATRTFEWLICYLSPVHNVFVFLKSSWHYNYVQVQDTVQ